MSRLKHLDKSYRIATLYIELDGTYIDFRDDRIGKRRLASQHYDLSFLEGYLSDIKRHGYTIHQIDNTHDNGM